MSQSEVDDLRHRMDIVEAKVDDLMEETAETRQLAAGADREVSEVKVELRAHRRSLQALRETQLEHGIVIRGLAESVGALVVGQAEHAGMLAEHSRVLSEHSQVLSEHSQVLSEHSQVLSEHSQVLGELRAGQAAIMAHLGVAGGEPPATAAEN